MKVRGRVSSPVQLTQTGYQIGRRSNWTGDRKSTRLNSSHANISYAVFCLKKKKKERQLEREKRQHRQHRVLHRVACPEQLQTAPLRQRPAHLLLAQRLQHGPAPPPPPRRD